MDSVDVPVVRTQEQALAEQAVSFYRTGDTDRYWRALDHLKYECAGDDKLIKHHMKEAGFPAALAERAVELADSDPVKAQRLVVRIRSCYPDSFETLLDEVHGFPKLVHPVGVSARS